MKFWFAGGDVERRLGRKPHRCGQEQQGEQPLLMELLWSTWKSVYSTLPPIDFFKIHIQWRRRVEIDQWLASFVYC